jgi:tetratricopeptide (TPR) repeat protein
LDINALKIAANAFKSALHSQDRQALIAAARRLVELEAPLGQQWQGLAQEVFRWGELSLALSALNVWHRQGTPASQVNYEKAVLLSLSGLTERAAKVAEALPPDFPTPVANAYLRGSLAVGLGHPEVGAQHFRRAVSARPDSGRSWLGLVQAGEVSGTDRQAMQALASSHPFEDQEDQAALENALGLLEERRGEYAAAFAHFERSTAIVRRQRPHSMADNERSARIAASWLAPDLQPAEYQSLPPSRRPIFVTGLARSGTTLVQQILAAHSAVDGGAELGLAIQVEAMAGGFSPADFRAYLAAGGMLADLRDTYLRLVAERIPGEGAFVDKSLNQSRSLGPYALLFPDSPVIWLRRDPLDNAWSIFRTWLSRSAVSGWSLEDIAHHMKLEDALFEHWSRELGDRLLAVPYSDLIERPDEWIERITRHCGLVQEPAQSEFHRAARGVSTASAIQVREPINRRGIGSAERYRPFLKPFIDAYEA